MTKQDDGQGMRINRRSFCCAGLATSAALGARQLFGAEKVRRAVGGAPATKIGDEFKPGDRVPVSGVYDVTHDKLDGDDHASPHQVTAIAGRIFPPCRWCATEVRFRLHHAALHVGADAHFRG